MEDVGSREPHSFPGNLWEVHHLQEETVQMDRVNAVHGIQPDEGFQGKWPIGQTGRGFRVKVNLPTFKDEKAKDAVTYCSW